ncbi:hypothetical protein TorRG33x02_050040, partial [Trema orientale]
SAIKEVLCKQNPDILVSQEIKEGFGTTALRESLLWMSLLLGIRFNVSSLHNKKDDRYRKKQLTRNPNTEQESILCSFVFKALTLFLKQALCLKLNPDRFVPA